MFEQILKFIFRKRRTKKKVSCFGEEIYTTLLKCFAYQREVDAETVNTWVHKVAEKLEIVSLYRDSFFKKHLKEKEYVKLLFGDTYPSYSLKDVEADMRAFYLTRWKAEGLAEPDLNIDNIGYTRNAMRIIAMDMSERLSDEEDLKEAEVFAQLLTYFRPNSLVYSPEQPNDVNLSEELSQPDNKADEELKEPLVNILEDEWSE